MKIFRPDELARMRQGNATRHHFGGGGGSSSETQSSVQNQYDNRTLTQNDNHAQTSSLRNVGNTSNTSSWWQANNDSHALSNSANTSNTSSWWQANSDSHAVSNAGNTSTRVQDSGNTTSLSDYFSALSNVGNTSDSRSFNNADSRSFNSADSHALSNVGNTSDSRSFNNADSRSFNNADSRTFSNVDSRSNANSGNTTVTNTGTDGGSVAIASMNAQLTGAIADGNRQTLASMASLGANVGNNAADLAALTNGNSMRLSEHMLNLTGELIDRIATGASTSAAAQSQMISTSAATANTANKTAGDNSMKMIYIAGALLVAALAFKR